MSGNTGNNGNNTGFNVLNPTTKEMFVATGPGWIIRNAKNASYALGVCLLIVVIIIYLFYSGKLSYNTAEKKPAGKSQVKSILKKTDSSGGDSADKTPAKSANSSASSSAKSSGDGGPKNKELDDMRKAINDINNSQSV